MNTRTCDGPSCTKVIRIMNNPEDTWYSGYIALMMPDRSRRDFCSPECLLGYVRIVLDREKLEAGIEEQETARILHAESLLTEQDEGSEFRGYHGTVTFEIDFPAIPMLNACFLQSTLERAWKTRVFVRDVTEGSECSPRLMHSKGYLCDKGHCR